MFDFTFATRTADLPANRERLRWAAMSEVIGSKRMRSQLEQVKYGIRYLLARHSRNEFLQRVSNSEFGRSLFESNPTNFYVPLRSYLDNRFTTKERFDVCLKDVQTATAKFGEIHASALLHGSNISLFEVGTFRVDLQMNRVSQHEGFWAVSIKDDTNQSIANLSFDFLDTSTILIASIQGIKDSSRNILQLNKQLTKDAFGLRPSNLLIATIQSLCQAWDISNLIGIDPKNQVKRKINTEKQGFKFDYIGFWNELGATKNFSGYWTLNNKTPIKQIDEVPSHKRNQYRKRNALLELISANSLHLFQET